MNNKNGVDVVKKQVRKIFLGPLPIGGGSPVVVQSMTNTDTRDVEATLEQILRLEAHGCEVVRLAIPDQTAAKALKKIRAGTTLPLIGDIHFDYRLAIQAVEEGLEGIRINPGNIGADEHVFKIVDAARANGAVIRIGVNSGSVEKDLLAQYGGPTPVAMVQSAVRHIALMEKRGFENIKLSIKSSSVLSTIEAYRRLRAVCDYPLHIGITEAGGLMRGTVKSAVGLGILLHEGIGDTLRVSLTADPVEEVRVAWEILRALGLRKRGPEVISCPTCGRTEIDLFALANAVEQRLATSTADITVAVMGCVVNGPGEAREADLGLAGGRDKGLIFRKGEIVRSAKGQENLLAAFMDELQVLLDEKQA